MAGLIKVEVTGDAGAKLAEVAGQLKDGRSLFRALAGTLEAETEANFGALGKGFAHLGPQNPA